MEQIQHKNVEVSGLKLHMAELGTGEEQTLCFDTIGSYFNFVSIPLKEVPVQVLRRCCSCMVSLKYGIHGGTKWLPLQPLDTEQLPEPEKASFDDLVVDVIGVMDSLGISKAFLVGKDFGAGPVFHVAVLHPERVSGVITLGIPCMLPGFSVIPMHLLPKGFYVLRWQEPGRAEADFGRFDVKTVIRNIYMLFCRSELQVASDDQEIMDLADPSAPLPPWFTEEDLKVYSSLYENSGFRTALQVPYRTLGVNFVITDPKITAPGMLIMGEKYYVLKFPGMEEYIRSEKVKEFMPNLEIIFHEEGNHFVQEQLPEEVNQLLITFLNKHST